MSWTIHAIGSWTDAEPDTFEMSVESAHPDSERFLVVSGCATWLNKVQAKEVRNFMDFCLTLIEVGPSAKSSEIPDIYHLSVKEFFTSKKEQINNLPSNRKFVGTSQDDSTE